MRLRSWLADWCQRSFSPWGRFGRRARTRRRSTDIPAQPEALETRCLLTTIDLANAGAAGTIIVGVDANDFSNHAVSNAGDVNGDGFDDFIVGAELADGTLKADAGRSYLIFGGVGLPATIDVASLGTAGMTIIGADTGDRSGHAVSSAGDINGDGYDDLIIGADQFGTLTEFGRSYVIFGAATLPASIDLATLGTAGVSIFGAEGHDLAGCDVSNAGDVNGDGYADLIIGARFADGPSNSRVVSGETYLIFGQASMPTTINLGNLGAVGTTIFGANTSDESGSTISAAGDVNGDGLADLLIGAPVGTGSAQTFGRAGETFVVFGRTSWPATFDLATLVTGGGGVKIDSSEHADGVTFSVSAAGDVNGDGFADLVIGEPYADTQDTGDTREGQLYVVFGGPALPTTILLNNLGSQGITMFGVDVGDRLGKSVSNAGDVNGDGYDDLMISAWQADGVSNGRSGSGETYVIFGGSSFPSTTNLANLGAGGITILGAAINDRIGITVSTAGDLNGDGFSDLLIGARNSSGATLGMTYVVYGADFSGSVSQLGTGIDDVFTGNSFANVLLGSRGNDTLVGNGGVDVLYGGNGNDSLSISDLAFRRIDGGNGTDTLHLDSNGMALDLTTLADNALTNIEMIDLSGDGANTLTLSVREVLNLTQNSNPDHAPNTLTIRREHEDIINMGPGWTKASDTLVGGVVYRVFVAGTAVLRVESTNRGIDLAIPGTAGTTIVGLDSDLLHSHTVSNAGDVNGDGFNDIILGSDLADVSGKANAGESYLIFGGPGLATTIDVASLGTAGMTILGGAADDHSGRAVSSAGDVNGDGFDDLLIGADQPVVSTAHGKGYLIFGAATLPGSIDLATLNTAGITFVGADEGDAAGYDVSSVGDVNGDGYADLIVGAKLADGPGNTRNFSGESYLIFGQPSMPTTINLGSPGTPGTIIFGADAPDFSGHRVSSAGDVNGDGFGDLLIGAPVAKGSDTQGARSGESYVIFGRAAWPGTIDIANLGTYGIKIFGDVYGDGAGDSISGAGDVNGDGFADLIIGAAYADRVNLNDTRDGEVYVVFGGPALPPTILLNNLGTQGIRFFGVDALDRLGKSVTNAGDVNGDGFDDILFSAWQADGPGNSRPDSGECYLIWGGPSFPTSIDLSDMGAAGIEIFGPAADATVGASVSTAGDLNGDGFSDLLIAGHIPNSVPSADVTYVIYGGDFTGAVSLPGTSISDVLSGSSAANVLIGGRGNDSLLGNGGADVLYGGNDDDSLSVSDLNFLRVDGGNGTDTLHVAGNGMSLNLTTLADTRLTNIEIIDLRGNGSNALTLSVREVLNLTQNSNPDHAPNTLTIRREKEDVINIGPGWTSASDVELAGVVYRVYVSGAAVLRLESLAVGIDLGNLSPAGITIYGADANDNSGVSVSDAGDINGDGYDDMIIGVYQGTGLNNQHPFVGESYLVFGGPTLPAVIQLGNLGSAGIALYGGSTSVRSGFSVSGGGDVNGDGYDDLIIGSPRDSGPSGSRPGTGGAFLIFGGPALPSTIVLDNISGIGVTFFGKDDYDHAGSAVSTAGDVNGDGFDDLLIGAYGADGMIAGSKVLSGESYVVFGGTSWPATIDLGTLGAGGVTIFGHDFADISGSTVSNAGDVNGDGFGDLLIGAPYAWGIENGLGNAGECALIFGGAALPQVIDLANPTVPVMTFYGAEGIDRAARSISNAGDVNGDGYGDLLIGAPSSTGSERNVLGIGEGYLVFGAATLPSVVDLGKLNEVGAFGIKLFGIDEQDRAGRSVSGAGDVNGDGFDDILVAAYFADAAGNAKDGAGESYLIFGGTNLPQEIDLGDLSAGGITLFGADGAITSGSNGDSSGKSLSNAGDVNGDGFGDFLIGAQYSRGFNNGVSAAGETYLIFGGNFTGSVSQPGTSNSDVLSGSSLANVLIGGRGDDTLIGNGGVDVLYGGSDDDSLLISDLNFRRVDGGNGTDTLILDSNGMGLDLTTLADNRLTNIEVIDLRGHEINTLSLDVLEVLNLTQNSNSTHRANTLTVRRDKLDIVNIGPGWTTAGDTVEDNVVYKTYVQGAGVLLLESIATTIDLAGLGIGGVTIYGIDENDHSGGAVSNAGDVNGDGFDDFIIGAENAYGTGNLHRFSGESYLIFGAPVMPTTLDLANLGTAGIVIYGTDQNDQSGHSVSTAGDVNGDGFDDLIIGAYRSGSDLIPSGSSYVIFGAASLPGTISLATLGTAGITITGAEEGDMSGCSVSNAGDVNGDGYSDLLIGAYGADGVNNGVQLAGEGYIIFGNASMPETIDLGQLETAGVTVFGINLGDGNGHTVSNAGDVNGDGFADLLIGAAYSDGFENSQGGAGECYLLFGRAVWPATVQLAIQGSGAITFYGELFGDLASKSMSSAGDLNGDGFTDLVIGAPDADIGFPNTGEGEVYVIFGAASLPSTIRLENLGAAGISIRGINAGDRLGRSVSNGGDFNGDGYDDLLISGHGADGPGESRTNSGESYLIYGGPLLPQTIDLSNLELAGITIYGRDASDLSGNSVSYAGDVNGDGFSDLLIGAYHAASAGNLTSGAGESYIVFGGNFTDSVDAVGTSTDDAMFGSFFTADVLNGAGGPDLLVGGGQADVLYGGSGDDVLAINDMSFRRVDGGNGSDTLRLDGAGKTLDLTIIADSRAMNIEAIDIRGSGANTLVLNFREVVNITQNSNPQHTANTLRVRRNADDSVDMGSGWSVSGKTVVADVVYKVYTQGAATLLVETATTIDLGSLGPSTWNGMKIIGADASDLSGYSVSNAGDVNGDGFDDLLIGAMGGDGAGNSRNGAGESYLVFGSASLPQTIDLATLGAAGVTIFGAESSDGSGISVSSAGDVNADGFADLLIGAFQGDASGNNRQNSGDAYIVFGKATMPATIDLASLGLNGVTISGAGVEYWSGWSVSDGGDVNGDGYDDVIIGAPQADGIGGAKFLSGESYVLFGSVALPTTIDLANLGSQGITIYGGTINDVSGSKVSSAGDVNGDGYDDLLVGAWLASGAGDARPGSGESYLIFGGSTLPPTIDLGNLGATGVTFFGAENQDLSGMVSNVGDVNGDGFDDLLIGAYRSYGAGNLKKYAGETYVVFGKSNWSGTPTIDLGNLGSAGITLFGATANDYSGIAVSGAGDVNGDGFDDLLIGAPRIDRKGNTSASLGASGNSYLVFGSGLLPATLSLGALTVYGFTFNGVDFSDKTGWSVSNAGDLNGDGFGDLLIGARSAFEEASGKTGSGETYVVFGGDIFTESVTHLGTSAGETITGTASANVINGAAGNDILVGDGGADVIYGGNGNDTLAISDLTFVRIDGGNGADTLRLDGAGLVLNLSAIADNRLVHIETIDMRGSGANTLTLNLLEVLNLTANSNPAHTPNTLTVRRDANDTVNIGPGWTFSGTEIISSELYSIYTQGAATLNVTNQTPVFTSSANLSVPENQTGVTTVVATDADLPAQTVTYSITGGADAAKFLITTGGVLTFATAPNFEVPTDVGPNNVYNVQVTANDGVGGLTAQNIAVTVTPVNELPVFTSPTAYSVPENVTAVGTVTVNDPDLPVQTVTFSLSGGADQGRFSITNGGVLTFATAPDYENPSDADTNNVYIVQVTANDGNGGVIVQTISVTVTPTNDLPIFTSPATFNVAENTTTVGTVAATDGDLPPQTVTYSLTGGADQSKFSLTGGVLRFVSAPNIEAPTDAGGNNVYDVQVSANDGNGGVTVQNIAVTVTPVNEFLPVFTSSPTLSVPENTTAVGTIRATDADMPALTVTYSITGGVDQAKFSITLGGLLSFVAAPDAENPTDVGTDNIYNVQVTANDGSGGTTFQNIAVTVTAANDSSPVFTSSANRSVPENTTAVGTVTATDADVPAQTIIYSITGGADQGKFSITGEGVLTFVTAPDFEAPSDADANGIYNVQVTANDGNGGLTVQSIAVTVTPVNEAPAFTSPAAFTVSENSTAIGTLAASDFDLPAQTVTFSISGGSDQSKFAVTAGGILTFKVGPDFDVPGDVGGNNVYDVQVTASDGNGGSATQNITVTVTGVEDNAPVFTSPLTFSMQENTTAIGTVTATDADRPVQSVTITISGGIDAALFQISSAGALTFVTAPDFENPGDDGDDNVYNLQVQASDGNGGVTFQNTSVTVTGVNDNVPVFNSAASFTVSENSTAVGTVMATDADALLQPLTYTLSGGSDQARFTLTSGGVLAFAVAPDFENPNDVGTDHIYNVQVTAHDDSGGSSFQNITVAVLAINDNAPVFTSPATFNVAENLLNVGTVAATDADQPAQVVSFNISGGADAGKFVITPSGSLTFITPPNFETPTDNGANNVYDVQVRATDGQGGVTFQNIAVTVTAVNEVPVFTSAATFSIPENSVAVGTATATDVDSPVPQITFTISGGIDQSKFSITGAGVLTFKTPPDYELPTDADASNSYLVQITANDGSGGLTTQNITVNVTPVNDNMVVITSPSVFNVPENVTTVGTLVATDADLPFQPVTFAINGGFDSAKFFISGDVLKFFFGPDFEVPGDVGANNQYEVQIVANDGQGGQVTQNIVVNVTAVNDRVPTFTSSATFVLKENTTVVGTVVATDADTPAQTVTYSISGGVDQQYFSITPGGALSFIAPPDFEVPADVGGNNIYNVQIKADDGNGGTNQQNLAITVTNVDDAPPIASIVPVSPDPRNTALNSIEIMFNEIVTGFDMSDLSLRRNGGSHLLTGSESLTTLNNISFTLSGLSGLTSTDGVYTLTLTSAASGIADVLGNVLLTGATESWLMDQVSPTAAIVPVSPDPRPSAVNAITIVFNEAVSGFSLDAITLTRDGGANLLNGLQTLTTQDNITYTLGNVGDITRPVGNYVLTLQGAGSGITDLAGNPLMDTATETWNRTNPFVSLSVNKSVIAEAGETATVTATLAAVSDIEVTVVLGFSGSATNPADYLRGAALLTIPAGSLTASLTVTSRQDLEFEGTEFIVVDINTVTNATEDGIQQSSIQIADDDHAPVFTTPATATIPENSTSVMSVNATDADVPSQTITYSIAGGADQGLLSITANGDLSFKSAPDFDAPADSDGDNVYEVQVQANDGHGGTTIQNVRVTVADLDDAPQLVRGGPEATWVRRQGAVSILPLVAVRGAPSLAGGTLTVSINVVSTPKKQFDVIGGISNFSGFGTSTGPQLANGHLTLQIQLDHRATNALIQSFLRGLTFATKGKGMKTATRMMDVTLTAGGLTASVSQTVHISKKPVATTN